jgi:ribosomal protein S6
MYCEIAKEKSVGKREIGKEIFQLSPATYRQMKVVAERKTEEGMKQKES